MGLIRAGGYWELLNQDNEGKKGSLQSQIIIKAKVVYRIQNGHHVNFELKLEPITVLEKKPNSLRICYEYSSKPVTEP